MTLQLEIVRSQILSELSRVLADARGLRGAARDGTPISGRTAPDAVLPAASTAPLPGELSQPPESHITVTEWSPQLEHAMNLLKQWFQPLGEQEMTPLLHLLSQQPQLTEQIFSVVASVAQQSTPAQKGANVHLAIQVSDALTSLAESQAVAERDAAPTWTAQSTPQHAPALASWLGALNRAVASFADGVKSSPSLLHDFLQSMHFAIREAPQSIEQEIVALPVALRAGLSVPEYHTIVNDNDPMRLALTLQAARTAGPKALRDFVAQLQRAVDTEQSTAAVIDAFVSAHPTAAHPLANVPNVAQLHALTHKQITVTEGADEAIQLFAFSETMGAVPAHHWRVTQFDGAPLPNAAKLAWDAGVQGALLVTKAFGAGLYPLRITARDTAGNESWLELLLYVVRGIVDESMSDDEEDDGADATAEEPPAPTTKPTTDAMLAARARQHAQAAYEHATPPPPQKNTLGATLQFTLRAPHIFVRRATPRAIPAPLHVSLHFLADLVDPQTKCSREHFLRIPQSPAAANLRAAIHDLNAQTSGAFDQFVKTLDTFFTNIRHTLQSAQIPALEHARIFVRDTALQYLTGKSPKALSGHQQLASMTPRGDVVACVFSTTSEVLAASRQYGDALIHCSNAADVAQNKPYFLNRLDAFMGRLRERLTPHAGKQAWDMHLPALPLPNTETAATARAVQCVQSLRSYDPA